jgi:hypothetical protein
MEWYLVKHRDIFTFMFSFRYQHCVQIYLHATDNEKDDREPPKIPLTVFERHSYGANY